MIWNCRHVKKFRIKEQDWQIVNNSELIMASSNKQVTDEEYHQLFLLIEQNPSLYDTSSKSYKDQQLNLNIWNSIATKMQKPEIDGQTWKKFSIIKGIHSTGIFHLNKHFFYDILLEELCLTALKYIFWNYQGSIFHGKFSKFFLCSSIQYNTITI